jgi:RIO1 family
MGKLANYRSLQRIPTQKILDDRPRPDSVPPVSLLYDGFGYFMDIFSRRGEICDLDTKRQDLETAVDSFAEKMTYVYNNEANRREEGLWALNNILSLRSGGGNKLMAASIDTCRTDGHYDGPHEATACIVEFKNELVDIGSMPIIELTSYVAHSHKQAMERFREVFSGWRVPCLGLTIVGKPNIFGSLDESDSDVMYIIPGPYVTFYAITFLHQWRVVSLTPTLSCIASACEGDDRKALYAAFSGALVLLDRIDEDAARFITTPPPTIDYADRQFPYISALPKYGTPNENVQFRILGLHPDTQDYRLLYIAETSDKKQMMVKFTRRYSIELHAFCTGCGHAPGILGFGKLPGGWFVVAMDYISPLVHLSRSPNLARLCNKWIDDLQKLMQSIHDHGLVHGDLREPNMLCDGEKVILVDFDWGGKVGEAYYPTARLCPELMDGRHSTDPKITKDDDRRVLENTLKELKNKK